MGKEYTEINPEIQAWIGRQHMFFVSTAPLAGEGLINCSPKGLESLRVLGLHKMAYLDIGGSGIETVAHLKENGRIVIMMCAFSGPPKIYRFYGQGAVIEPQDEGFDALLGEFPSLPAARNIIVIEVERIIDSCGYGVPLYDFQKDRNSLQNYYASKAEKEVLAYRAERNSLSLDGLQGLHTSDQRGV